MTANVIDNFTFDTLIQFKVTVSVVCHIAFKSANPVFEIVIFVTLIEQRKVSDDGGPEQGVRQSSRRLTSDIWEGRIRLCALEALKQTSHKDSPLNATLSSKKPPTSRVINLWAFCNAAQH